MKKKRTEPGSNKQTLNLPAEEVESSSVDGGGVEIRLKNPETVGPYLDLHFAAAPLLGGGFGGSGEEEGAFSSATSLGHALGNTYIHRRPHYGYHNDGDVIGGGGGGRRRQRNNKKHSEEDDAGVKNHSSEEDVARVGLVGTKDQLFAKGNYFIVRGIVLWVM